ncbi:MAG TPA: hypothetical protein VMT17_06770 [Anaeromyxobacteraceae bacterium]|nr:hypothetical protein [Anaeromyxobacteraceae bacterium]
MAPIPRRLPHVVTRADLCALIVPTYAAALGVDEEEAEARLGRALERPGVADDLYRALAAGLEEARGPRTAEDALLDRVSAGIARRRARVRAAEAGPALSAFLVRINVEIGLAPESMRGTLESERGRALLEEGLAALGRHLARELLKG